jgi:hypothetical protein
VKRLLSFLFATLFTCGFAAQEVRDSSTGAVFPAQISFDEGGTKYDLSATGVATRKKFGIKVYSVAHYLQGGDSEKDRFQQILEDDKAKQLTMNWLRSASQQQIKEGYEDSFRKTLSPSLHNQLAKDIQKYVSFFTESTKKGDVMVIRWTPGGKITLLMNDKELGTLTNPTFAKELWNLWFGDKSVVDRNQLVSLMK